MPLLVMLLSFRSLVKYQFHEFWPASIRAIVEEHVRKVIRATFKIRILIEYFRMAALTGYWVLGC